MGSRVKRFAWTLAAFLFLAGAVTLFVVKLKHLAPPKRMPPATQMLMDKLRQADRELLQALFLITNRASGRRATGLLAASGVILSDAHIAADARLQDLEVTSSKGERVPLRGMDLDRGLDIAFLLPARAPKGGMELGEGGDFGPGDQVYAWGFSEGFNPPQPLLCMGFVAGFHLAAGEPESEGATRLVLGGPFSEGFAGAPVFRWRDNQMVGLLVMRPAAHGSIAEAVPVQVLRDRLDRVE